MVLILRSGLGPAIHSLLLGSIEEHRFEDRGGRKTSLNTRGRRLSYRSVDMSLFSRPGFSELVSFVEGVVGAPLHLGWAVVHPKGGYNSVHDHVPHRVSTVYYVRVPDPSPAIFFRGDGWERHYYPSDGDLLVFPSSLNHGVEENLSDGLRVSVVLDFL